MMILTPSRREPLAPRKRTPRDSVSNRHFDLNQIRLICFPGDVNCTDGGTIAVKRGLEFVGANRHMGYAEVALFIRSAAP